MIWINSVFCHENSGIVLIKGAHITFVEYVLVTLTYLNVKVMPNEIREGEKHVVNVRNHSEKCQLEPLWAVKTLSQCLQLYPLHGAAGQHQNTFEWLHLCAVGCNFPAAQMHACCWGRRGAAEVGWCSFRVGTTARINHQPCLFALSWFSLDLVTSLGVIYLQ